MSKSRPDHDAINVRAPERSAVALRIKRAIQFCAWLLVIPRLIAYHLGRAILGRRALSSSSESIARIPGLRGLYLRQAFYQSVLDECGRDVVIGWGTLFSMTQARLGERAYIGRNCNIGYGMIGREAMLADGVIVLSGGREHGRESGKSMHQQTQTYYPVSIGSGAWIGAGAIIMADVGEHAIIGAGAVVNQPIPAGSIAVGVPARVVKWRDGWTESGQPQTIAEPKDI